MASKYKQSKRSKTVGPPSIYRTRMILTISDVNGASKLLKRPEKDEIPVAWLLH